MRVLNVDNCKESYRPQIGLEVKPWQGLSHRSLGHERGFDFASQTADIELFCSQLSRKLWCLVTCRAPVHVEAERQPITRTYWRCFVWCTAAKELQSLLWTIFHKSTVCDHKITLPPDSLENRLLDLRGSNCVADSPKNRSGSYYSTGIGEAWPLRAKLSGWSISESGR